MIVVNKTREKIHSHHRRGVLLEPGTNDIDDATLTRSERAMITALAKSKIVEVVEQGETTLPTKTDVAGSTSAAVPTLDDKVDSVSVAAIDDETPEVKLGTDELAHVGTITVPAEPSVDRRARKPPRRSRS